MVFPCSLVNRNLFAANHTKVSELLKLTEPSPVTLFLERDVTYEKCKHAIKVICQETKA